MSLERVKLELSNFIQRLTISHTSLQMTNHPLGGAWSGSHDPFFTA